MIISPSGVHSSTPEMMTSSVAESPHIDDGSHDVFRSSGIPSSCAGIINGPSLVNDWHVSNPFPGWRTITQDSAHRRKVQFLDQQSRELVRYEINGEGPHWHHETELSGVRLEIKVHIPKSIAWQEFAGMAPRIRVISENYVKEIKKILQNQQITG